MQDLLNELLAVETTPKLTLQIPAGADSAERSLRIRHQLEKIAIKADAMTVAPAAAATIVERAKEAADFPALAASRSGTAGIYIAGESTMSVQWPVPLPERATVGDDFYLADVIELVDPANCFVLTLSRGGVNLYRADHLSMERLELADIPVSLEESREHLDLERQLQFHQAGSVGRGGPTAMYHGHGIGEGREVEGLRSYLRAVDHGVRTAMGGGAGPVGLIGTDEMPAQFKAVSGLVDRIVEVDRKNPEGVGDDEVRHVADELLAHIQEDEATTARARILDSIGAGKASLNLQAVVGAALSGRVDTLLVGPEFGGSDAVVNRAVVATLRHRGRVLVDKSLTATRPLAGLFRY